MKQKGESQNGDYKKTKHNKFFEKKTFGVLSFPVATVLTFALLPYCQRNACIVFRINNLSINLFVIKITTTNKVQFKKIEPGKS